MTENSAIQRIRNLPLWQGEIDAVPLQGGITNVNFIVTDGFVRGIWLETGAAVA
jgi:hypothetical protein